MQQMNAVVISNKMLPTIKVQVVRRWAHPLYHKIVTRRKNYLAHCEIAVNVGDRVVLAATRPISKNKKWKVVKKI